MLDVGAGDGLFACYMALHGASEVVALEPEQDGSSSSALRLLRARTEALKLPIACHAQTFQDFTDEEHSFDVILAHNVINHLDEDAVTQLQTSEVARIRFRELLAKMHRLLKPDGVLILADCARDNLFPRLGLPNPLAPTIEWEKHQNPEVWRELLRQVGFAAAELHWTYPRRLRGLGPLLSRRWMSYCLDSHFVMHCRPERTQHSAVH